MLEKGSLWVMSIDPLTDNKSKGLIKSISVMIDY